MPIGAFLTLANHTWAVVGLIVVASAAAFAALAGLWQVFVSISNERKRNQPVVIAHESGGRQFGDRNNANTVLPTYLTNEGGGPAFNVRFGAEFGGVRYPWRYSDADDDGTYQRVIRSGARMPEGAETFRVEIPWESFRAGSNSDQSRVYWCRYENAYGKTWETRNPVDRSSGLDIRRVRFLRWQLRREAKRRAGNAKIARKALARDLELMAAQADNADQQAVLPAGDAAEADPQE